jgi:2'-5' RNA ligase
MKGIRGRGAHPVSMKFRAFVSVDIRPGEPLISAVRDLQRSRADLKIVRTELMHLTLKFLGDTDEDLIDDLMARIAGASDGVEPFSIHLKGMGAFPSLSNIRVVWVGIEDGRFLTQIAGKLDGSMSDMGFERDKKGFVPHLTLARTRSPKNIINVQEILRTNAATDFGEYKVDRILLKKSVLNPQGPVYSTVGEHLLGKTSD